MKKAVVASLLLACMCFLPVSKTFAYEFRVGQLLSFKVNALGQLVLKRTDLSSIQRGSQYIPPPLANFLVLLGDAEIVISEGLEPGQLILELSESMAHDNLTHLTITFDESSFFIPLSFHFHEFMQHLQSGETPTPDNSNGLPFITPATAFVPGVFQSIVNFLSGSESNNTHLVSLNLIAGGSGTAVSPDCQVSLSIGSEHLNLTFSLPSSACCMNLPSVTVAAVNGLFKAPKHGSGVTLQETIPEESEFSVPGESEFSVYSWKQGGVNIVRQFYKDWLLPGEGGRDTENKNSSQPWLMLLQVSYWVTVQSQFN